MTLAKAAGFVFASIFVAGTLGVIFVMAAEWVYWLWFERKQERKRQRGENDNK